MPKRSSKRKTTDLNQNALRIVRVATEDEPHEKDPHAVALGRRGGLKGGKERARRLSPERRAEIAREAAERRWKKNGDR